MNVFSQPNKLTGCSKNEIQTFSVCGSHFFDKFSSQELTKLFLYLVRHVDMFTQVLAEETDTRANK